MSKPAISVLALPSIESDIRIAKDRIAAAQAFDAANPGQPSTGTALKLWEKQLRAAEILKEAALSGAETYTDIDGAVWNHDRIIGGIMPKPGISFAGAGF